MKYESPEFLRLSKEFEIIMKAEDFDSAKKVSAELERLKIEDQNLLIKRKENMRYNMLKKYKEQQRKEMEHFKMLQESELIELQNKWTCKLDIERKKINYNNINSTKINNTMLMEQKIITSNKEPRDSIKAKVNPKTKTNVNVKEKLVESIRATIIKNRDKLGIKD